MTKSISVEIKQAEINEAGYCGWEALLRKHGIDPDQLYRYDRAAHRGFNGVIVTGSPLKQDA